MNSNWSYSPESSDLGQNHHFFVPCGLDGAPLLYPIKLCESFHHHMWNWVVCNVECRCMAITGANIPVPCHMCRSLWLGWGLGTRWCVQRVPGHRLGCGDQEMGCGVVALVVPGGRHAPLDWNSYCVHELAHNTLLFLLVFFTNNCCFSIKVAMYYYVWVEIRDK